LPVAAQQFAHRRAGSDAGEHVVAGGGEQAFLADVRVADILWRLFHHWARIGKGIALTARMAENCSRISHFAAGSEIRFKSKMIFYRPFNGFRCSMPA
jgi:hypothetical protein